MSGLPAFAGPSAGSVGLVRSAAAVVIAPVSLSFRPTAMATISAIPVMTFVTVPAPINGRPRRATPSTSSSAPIASSANARRSSEESRNSTTTSAKKPARCRSLKIADMSRVIARLAATTTSNGRVSSATWIPAFPHVRKTRADAKTTG